MLDRPATAPEPFPWQNVSVTKFKRLKSECPELFALAGRVNVLSDLLDRYTSCGEPDLDGRAAVQLKTRQLTTLVAEVNNLFQTLNA